MSHVLINHLSVACNERPKRRDILFSLCNMRTLLLCVLWCNRHQDLKAQITRALS